MILAGPYSGFFCKATLLSDMTADSLASDIEAATASLANLEGDAALAAQQNLDGLNALAATL